MLLINRFYNNLHEQILKVCHSMALPLHFNKTGYKHFDNYQRVALIILHIHSKKSLKDFLDDFKDSKWQHYLQLRRIPAKTTLHDWLELFKLKVIRLLNKQLTQEIKPVLTAIDGTGLDSHQRSRHYEKRLKDFGTSLFPKSPFTKLDIWIDIETQMILDFNLVTQPRHDVVGAEKIFKRNILRDIEILADKGYDSEPLHRIVKQKGGKLIAPVRSTGSKKRPKGQNRRKCLQLPFYYNMRSIVETVNSVLKRVQIPALRSRKACMKKREMGWHVLLYNMKRISLFYFIQFLSKLNQFLFRNWLGGDLYLKIRT